MEQSIQDPGEGFPWQSVHVTHDVSLEDEYVPNATYFLATEWNFTYVLMRNNVVLRVQIGADENHSYWSPPDYGMDAGPCIGGCAGLPCNPVVQLARPVKVDTSTTHPDMFASDLGSIQLVLRSLDFERGNWAYILPHEDGTVGIKYAHRVPPRPRCLLWAPFVDAKDIKVTKSFDNWRQGILNGMQVDVQVFYWNDVVDWNRCLVKESDHLKVLRDLGLSHLTFQLIAHVVDDREEDVLGFITEPCLGRQVRYEDRTAVYEAISTLQSKGVLYRSIDDSSIVITKEGVRFLNISSVLFFGKDRWDELEAEAQRWHWWKLEGLFARLRSQCRIHHEWIRMPLLSIRAVPSAACLIPPLPKPYQPTSLDIDALTKAFRDSVLLNPRPVGTLDIVHSKEEADEYRPNALTPLPTHYNKHYVALTSLETRMRALVSRSARQWSSRSNRPYDRTSKSSAVSGSSSPRGGLTDSDKDRFEEVSN